MDNLAFSQEKNNTDCSAQHFFSAFFLFVFVFVTCITGALSPYPICNSFDWAGPVQLADFHVLTNQVAFVKCVSQCLNIPVLTALSVVFNSPSYNSIFPEAGA